MIFAANSALGEAHNVLAYFVVISTGLAASWALLAHWLKKLRHKFLWWFTTFAYVTVAVEVILGSIQQVSEDIDLDGFHAFYGFLAFITAALIYSYRNQLANKKFLLFGLGGLFLMGLAIRAMTVGV